MSSTRKRLAVIAGALVVLSLAGAGLALAAPASPTPTQRMDESGLGRFGRILVHGTVVVIGRDGEPVTLQFDHGTLAEIGDGSISISEATGTTVTIATTDETRVRRERVRSSLDALALGDEVLVVSVVEGGSATARLVAVPIAPRDANPT